MNIKTECRPGCADGPLEFIIVADDKADPALHAAQSLAPGLTNAAVHTIVAPPARTSSQKIHSLQAGIRVRLKGIKYRAEVPQFWGPPKWPHSIYLDSVFADGVPGA